jgi:hypothetical protein
VNDIANQFPTEVEALQALVVAARAERDAAIAERDQAVSQMDRLRHLLRQLQRAHFGRRSEKLDPDQLQLALEDIERLLPATLRPTTRRTRWPPAREPTSAAPAGARFPPICRTSM